MELFWRIPAKTKVTPDSVDKAVDQDDRRVGPLLVQPPDVFVSEAPEAHEQVDVGGSHVIVQVTLDVEDVLLQKLGYRIPSRLSGSISHSDGRQSDVGVWPLAAAPLQLHGRLAVDGVFEVHRHVEPHLINKRHSQIHGILQIRPEDVIISSLRRVEHISWQRGEVDLHQRDAVTVARLNRLGSLCNAVDDRRRQRHHPGRSSGWCTSRRRILLLLLLLSGGHICATFGFGSQGPY
mmetsp:Transcript_7633/g.18656  ORF Transcript_7633/g.18656 Transcript_7633/m.18656 type:complete len:236 (+) Transcript_7633:2032-2739(+)